MSPHTCSRQARVFAAALILAAGCRTAGRQVVEGVSARRDTLAGAVRPAARALVEEAGRAFDDSVRQRLTKAAGELGDSLNVAFDTLLDRLGRRLDSMEASLARFASTEGRDAVRELIGSNLNLARDSLRTAVRLWVGEFSRSIDTLLPGALGRLSDSAAHRAANSLARNIGRDGPLRLALVALSDTVVRQAIVAIRDESQKGTPWWVWALVAAFGLLVVSVVGGFLLRLVRAKRHRETSLRLVTRAIQERGDRALAERVKALAIESGVEPSLHEFLDEHRLLVAERPRGSA